MSKKERVLYFLLEEDSETSLSHKEKKELVRAIVRYSRRLELPDGTKLGGYTPETSLFLYAWAKTRTNLSYKSPRGSGILALQEPQIISFEKKSGAEIDREFDIFVFNVQYKLATILFKEYLSGGKSAKEAYLELNDLSLQSEEWSRLEAVYRVLHEKVMPLNE